MVDRYTSLQWMGPQLARSGLVLNEGWVERRAAEACALYIDKRLHPMASLLAVMHEHALDYLRQAPILVLGVWGKPTARPKSIDRQMIAYKFGPLIRRGMKLKTLMGEFGLPLPMRKILPVQIDCDRTNLFLDRLARMIEPSALSQAIPEDAGAQSDWLCALARFDARARLRVEVQAMGRAAYAERFAWAAPALARAIAAGEDVTDADDMVDYLASRGHPFNPRWSWLRARELSHAWHRGEAEGARDTARIGFPPEGEFDFSPFPERRTVQGLEFVALRSVLALREEGRKMQHCVGGYHAELSAGHRFYSIRRAGQLLATAQLVHSTAVQVKGPRNADPKKEVMVALGKFLERAAAGEFPDDEPADEPSG